MIRTLRFFEHCFYCFAMVAMVIPGLLGMACEGAATRLEDRARRKGFR